MNSEPSNDFIQIFTLFYNFCNICGVPTVMINQHFQVVSKLRFVHCIGVTAVFYVTFWFTCRIISGVILATNDVVGVVSILTLLFGVCYTSMCIVMNVFFFKRRVDLILNMSDVQCELEHFCGQRSANLYRNVARIAISIAFFKITFQVAVCLYYPLANYEFGISALWAPLTCCILELVWTETTFIEISMYLYILKTQFCQLNSALRNLLKRKSNLPLGSDTMSKIVNQVKVIHKKVSKVSEDMNKCFGVIILGQMSIMFIEITSGVYNIYRLESNYTVYYVVINAVLKCAWLCYLSDDVTEQIKAAGRAIYKIDTGIYKISLLNEIELVSLQALSYQNRFTAANFFNIDNRLLVGVIYIFVIYE
nr:unnamed protein product [Callosobruchus chinensis]